jgi:hypothetical protein
MRILACRSVQALSMTAGRNEDHKMRTVCTTVIAGGIVAGRNEEQKVGTVACRTVHAVRMAAGKN